MDYLYENLGDERFQEFCSALLSKEFPNIQAFPVGQPDGGRDTIVYSVDNKNKKFKVFQVKYVRNAHEQRDLHKWLEKIVKEEAPKVNKLIASGATEYYILTNIRGTAHLEAGSKDKINKILEDEIDIPAICWWRDDLTAMFEKDVLFKWSFPEVLNGQDVLNSALFSNLNNNKTKQESVIRAYLADQLELDSEVKFKQIDLQNKLTSLYTDVPLRIKKFNKKDRSLRHAMSVAFNSEISVGDDEISFLQEKNVMGAAAFLLHPAIQKNVSRILLEGGPGQGKSTISQYICHIHRAKLLKKESELIGISDAIKNAPIRLPFKIDLRHIASWVEGINPYAAVISEESFKQTWKKSLESFLITHIAYHSKIEDFSTHDFLEVSKLTPILFVFDGFDEIANIALRKEVISFIDKGIQRLSINIESIQVIITSRPAAFSETVVFSTENYPHFELVDITSEVITEYVDKWVKAGRMNARDSNEIKSLVTEKLKLPHLRELAKSPMQLAIFLSLLKTKGQSLPNKRTALYDSYINLFFDRESEKSNLVRDKRDLIIDIHQYLAWVLHSDAERYNNSGIIEFDNLKGTVKSYLEQEGHEVGIADDLFDVMKERVCALVSRVQGTFEFEVQPLREYFCAKYLYTTAQNSTAGEIRSGTKPDRFHALSRNFYWQNVLRFFAGCADAGELDMIIQELRDLQNDELLKYTHYPRMVTAQILADYVFTQKPKKLVHVVQLIVDGINIGTIVNQSAHVSRSEHIVLPEECGRKELVSECYSQLAKFPKPDYSGELISIIVNNPRDNLKTWLDYLNDFSNDKDITEWYRFAYRLQLLHQVDRATVARILSTKKEEHLLARIIVTLNAYGSEYLDDKLELKRLVVNKIVEREIETVIHQSTRSAVGFLTMVLHPIIAAAVFEASDQEITFKTHISKFLETERDGNSFDNFVVVDEVDELIHDFSQQISGVFETPLTTFKSSIVPWDILVESGRKTFGDRWAFFGLAVISAGLKGKSDEVGSYTNFDDTEVSLCKRTRYARLKSGNVKYWEDLFSSSSNKSFLLLVFITWATPKVILELAKVVSDVIRSIGKKELEKVEKLLQSTVRSSYFNRSLQREIETSIESLESYETLKFLISFRYPNDGRQDFILNFVGIKFVKTQNILPISINSLIEKMMHDQVTSATLAQIREIYTKATLANARYYYLSPEMGDIPLSIAKEVMRNCKDYPRMVGVAAERTCRTHAGSKRIPIGEIAERDKWFE